MHHRTEKLGKRIADHRYNADSSHQQHFVSNCIFSADHPKIRGQRLQYGIYLIDIAGCLLDGYDIRYIDSHTSKRSRHDIGPAAAGYIVDDYR